MPPFKGPEWEHVVILGQKGQNYKMECKYCKLKLAAVPPASASASSGRIPA
jgi:hypothetical protein